MDRPRLLSVTIARRSDLEKAYMPWLKRGGLFVTTTAQYHLGDVIYLLLTLPGETERFSVDGEVVWTVPPESGHHAQNRDPFLGERGVAQPALAHRNTSGSPRKVNRVRPAQRAGAEPSRPLEGVADLAQ